MTAIRCKKPVRPPTYGLSAGNGIFAPGWLTRFVARLKKMGTAIQTAVLAQRMSVDQVLERVGIGLIRCHVSGRPAFRKPSTKWSRTAASRSGWELSQWAMVK